MRQKNIPVFLTLLLIPFLLAAASKRPPDKGIYERVKIVKEDEAELIRNSEEMEELFYRRGARYEDPEVRAWLSDIGRAVAPESTDPYVNYRFFVIRDPSPNAFALADGQIYIHTGMLARLHNEAQLACLLGHEVNHVAGHHGLMVHRSNKKKATVGAVFGGIFGVVGAAGGWTGAAGSVAGGVTSISVVSAMLGYSRDLEKEADSKGFDRVLASDYDVSQCAGLFEEMGRDFDGLQPVVNAKWSTHPDLESRAHFMADKAAALDEYSPSARVVGDQQFQRMTRRIALLTVDDYIGARYPASAVAIAKDLTTRYPEDAQAWTALGRAYHALGPESQTDGHSELTKKQKLKRQRERFRLNRNELREKQIKTEIGQINANENLDLAIAAFDQALLLESELPDAYIGLGDCHYELNNDQESAKAYIRYLKLYPDTAERHVVMNRLRALKNRLKESRGELNDA